MNLRELLQELRENILHDRSDQVAGASDQLWSDATLVRYINEAQRRFAREAQCLRDGSTPEVCRLKLETGRREYPLHESIIAVISVKYDGDIADLARAGHAQFGTYHQPDTYFFDPSSLSTLPPGKVVAYDTDEQLGEDEDGSLARVTLRVYPVPDPVHAGTVLLRVLRYPLDDLSIDQLDAIPEIPRDHHLDMLSWAAYLALRIVDRDQGDPERAAEFRSMFEQHVAEARGLAKKKQFTPLQWGFGRGGWAWGAN